MSELFQANVPNGLQHATLYGIYRHYKNINEAVPVHIIYEPRHDKTYKMSVLPAKTKISLGPWSDSSLGAQPVCWFYHVATHISNHY